MRGSSIIAIPGFCNMAADRRKIRTDDDASSFIRPFEWLTNAESLKSLITQYAISAKGDQKETNGIKALHVGSGSSVVGEFLVESLDFMLVVNADKDEETMQKMEERWIERTRQSEHLDRLRFCVVDFAASPFPYEDRMFDLVLDKSTLDCTLCSDNATASLLLEVYRCLAVGGNYILVSFHEYDFLLPLLKVPGAHWDITHTTMQRHIEDISRINDMAKAESTNSIPEEKLPDTKPLNVFVARKLSSSGGDQLDFEVVCRHVHECNDAWFQQHQPLLTRTRTETLKASFICPLGLSRAYQELFTDAEREHLTYEHFLEDWNAFLQSNDEGIPKDSISYETALRFLEEMQ